MFVESLAPLLGDTPRAVKRFVNLYQLLRVILVDQDEGPQGVSQRELAAFLLAVRDADPDFAARLSTTPPATLAALWDPTPPAYLAPVPECVGVWLRSKSEPWTRVRQEQIAQLASTVERFSFGN